MSNKRKNFHYHYAEQYETRQDRRAYRRAKRRFVVPPVALIFALMTLIMFGLISTSFSVFVTTNLNDPDMPASGGLIVDVRNHAVRENTDSDFISRKADADVAGVGAERDLAGTGWQIDSGKKVYYMNTEGWDAVTMHPYNSNASSDWSMSKLANTNIFYYSTGQWNNMTAFYFYRSNYSSTKGSDVGTNLNQNAWFFGTSNTMHTSNSYTMYNTAKVVNMISTDGGSTFSETSDAKAITSISGYTLYVGHESATSVNDSTSSADGDASINAAFGSTVTMSASAGSGATFEGFSTTKKTDGLPSTIDDNTTKTYTAYGYNGEYNQAENDIYYAYYIVSTDCMLSVSPTTKSLKVSETDYVTVSAINHASGNVTVTVPAGSTDKVAVCATENGTYSSSATLTTVAGATTANVYVKGLRPTSSAVTLTASCGAHSPSTSASFTVTVSEPSLTVAALSIEEGKSGTLTATVGSGSPTPSSYSWSVPQGACVTLGTASSNTMPVTAGRYVSGSNTATVTLVATYSTGYQKTVTPTVTVTASPYFLVGFGTSNITTEWGYKPWDENAARRMVYNAASGKYEIELEFTGDNVREYEGGSSEYGFKVKNGSTYYTGSYSGNSKLTRSDSGTEKTFSTTGDSNNNAGINIDIVGTYKFAFDVSSSGSEKLTVTYPADVNIRYHTNGGTMTSPYTEVEAGALYTGTYPYATGLATLPTPTYSGFAFDGWYSDAELTTAVTSIAASTAVYDLYAKWSITSVSIRDNITGGEILTVSDIAYGGDITETVITGTQEYINNNAALVARGYTFNEWSPALTNVTTSTIYANYVPDTKEFDVSILPTGTCAGDGTDAENAFVITFGSAIKVQAAVNNPLLDNGNITYKWCLTENGTYVSGSDGVTYLNENIIATMPSNPSGYFDLYTRAYATDYNSQQIVATVTQHKKIYYKVLSPLDTVTLNGSANLQKIYSSTPTPGVTLNADMHQYNSQNLDNTKVTDFTNYKVDFQYYSFDSYTSLLEELLSITTSGNSVFSVSDVELTKTVTDDSTSPPSTTTVDTAYGALRGVQYFKYVLKRPVTGTNPVTYTDDSSLEFSDRVVIGSNMTNTTRPLYFKNNGSSLADYRVMLFYFKSGSLHYQTAQRIALSGSELYRFEIPTDADLQIQIAAFDKEAKYALPYYDNDNSAIYYYSSGSGTIPDTNSHCYSKMSSFVSVNAAGSEIQTLFASAVSGGTDASPGTITISDAGYTM